MNDSSNVMMETSLNHVHGADLGCLHLKKVHHYHLLMEYVAAVAVADGMSKLHPS